jgi:hypothetical protein
MSERTEGDRSWRLVYLLGLGCTHVFLMVNGLSGAGFAGICPPVTLVPQHRCFRDSPPIGIRQSEIGHSQEPNNKG